MEGITPIEAIEELNIFTRTRTRTRTVTEVQKGVKIDTETVLRAGE